MDRDVDNIRHKVNASDVSSLTVDPMQGSLRNPHITHTGVVKAEMRKTSPLHPPCDTNSPEIVVLYNRYMLV
jgi:hypothetical protein